MRAKLSPVAATASASLRGCQPSAVLALRLETCFTLPSSGSN
ncbi:hypothetical protein [Roseateles sp.]